MERSVQKRQKRRDILSMVLSEESEQSDKDTDLISSKLFWFMFIKNIKWRFSQGHWTLKGPSCAKIENFFIIRIVWKLIIIQKKGFSTTINILLMLKRFYSEVIGVLAAYIGVFWKKFKEKYLIITFEQKIMILIFK